jgi:hypothetical protein
MLLLQYFWPMASSDTLVLKTLEHGLLFHTMDELKKLLDLLPISVKKTRKADLCDPGDVSNSHLSRQPRGRFSSFGAV